MFATSRKPGLFLAQGRHGPLHGRLFARRPRTSAEHHQRQVAQAARCADCAAEALIAGFGLAQRGGVVVGLGCHRHQRFLQIRRELLDLWEDAPRQQQGKWLQYTPPAQRGDDAHPLRHRQRELLD